MINLSIRQFCISIFFLFYFFDCSSQIKINNASFELTNKNSSPLKYWDSSEPGSTPDVLPGFWGVKKKAYDGKTYVGLISRANGTTESIVQKLSDKLHKDSCYSFNIFISTSYNYAGYNKVDCKLTVMGFTEYDVPHSVFYSKHFPREIEVLGESEMIDYKNWKEIEFVFSPKKDVQYLVLKISTDEINKKGNILLDNMSPIFKCSNK